MYSRGWFLLRRQRWSIGCVFGSLALLSACCVGLSCVFLCPWKPLVFLCILSTTHTAPCTLCLMFLRSCLKLKESRPCKLTGVRTANEGTGGHVDSLCRSPSYPGLRIRLRDTSCVHLVPKSIPPSNRLNPAMLGFLTHQGLPQSQMAETRAQLSGQLRPKKIIICPIVRMSSLDCRECRDNCVLLHFPSHNLAEMGYLNTAPFDNAHSNQASVKHTTGFSIFCLSTVIL